MNKIKLAFVLLGRNIKWLWLKAMHGRGLYEAPVNDFKMYLDLSANGLDIKESSIFKQLALDRTREKEATKIMNEFLDKDDVVLEAGANIGYYALLESKINHGTGKVFAVEPEPKNVELLKKNLELNRYGDVEVRQMAFSDAEGTLPLYMSKNSNLHSFVKPKEGEYETMDIRTTTIDKFMEEKQQRINCVRMDIEGYECKVIHGMKTFMQQEGPLKLFIELHPHLVPAEEMVALLQKLKDNGFEVYKVISRDTVIRKVLGQTTVEDMTIDELMKDKRVTENICALETFFYKK